MTIISVSYTHLLSTHVLPYNDVRFLKHFEDVFERFYNSERFRTVFGYIGSKLIKEHTDTSITCLLYTSRCV